MDKIDEIHKILEKERRTNVSISYALFSTLSKEDLNLYIKKYYRNLEIRNELLRHITRKFETSGIQNILDHFIKEYKKSNNSIRRGINKIFTDLNEFMSQEQRKVLFDITINSEKKSIRKKGYEQANYIFSEYDITIQLSKNWFEYRDIEVIKIFVNNDEYNLIYDNFEKIWDDPEISIGLKHAIANGLGKNKFDILLRLKSKNLITYMSACYYAKDLGFLDTLFEILESSKTIGELSYCIWILGQLGLYNKIIECLPIIEKKEIELPRTFSEIQHDMLYGGQNENN